MPGGEPKPKDPEIIAGREICEKMRIVNKKSTDLVHSIKRELKLEDLHADAWN